MKVLVCGANGFIGSAVCRALKRSGHEVIKGVRQCTNGDEPAVNDERQIDFVDWLKPEQWATAIKGVDAVVNAVGVLRGTLRRPIHHIHALAPIALYEACAMQGVRRVIHISALGIAESQTPYAQTKRLAEQALEEQTKMNKLDGVIVRPSIVFGRGGQSSQLFMRLAVLPVHVLPQQAKTTRVQPISIGDLADLAAALVDKSEAKGSVDACGPEALTLSNWINSLRCQRGNRPAKQFFMPSALGRWSAVVADMVPVTPWGLQALELLSRDNTGDATQASQLLGRSLVGPHELVEKAWNLER